MSEEVDAKLKVSADTGDAERAMSSLGSSMEAAFAKGTIAAEYAMKAIEGVTAFMKESVIAAAEVEKINIRFGFAMESAGIKSKAMTEAIEYQITALAKLSANDDGRIKALFTTATQYGIAADSANEYVTAAIALENATGTDANEALRGLAKTLQGVQDRTLSLIPGVRELTEEQLRAGDAVKIINTRFGDLAKISDEGIGGAIRRLTNAWGGLHEEMGKSLAKGGAIAEAMDFMTTAAEFAKRHTDEVKQVLDAVGNAYLLTSPIIAFNLEAMKKLRDLMKESNAEAAGAFIPPEVVPTGAKDLIAGTGLEKFAPGKTETKKASPFSVDFSAMFEEGERMKIIADKNSREMLAITLNTQDLQTEITEANVNRRLQLIYSASQAEIDEGIRLQTAVEVTAGALDMAYTNMANVTVSALQAIAAGQDVSGKQVVKAFLTQTGNQLIADGTFNVFKGGAMALLGQPNGAALAALGGVEIAAGVSMAAGGAKISAGAIGGGAGPRLGGGTGVSAGTPTVGNPPAFGGGEQSPIVINVYGAMTNEETAMLVDAGMNRAAQKGLI